eukprot:TRINITY_DN10109_c0_g1_i1.p1 TRINITY_DN10109_c0_g1~~TRINITY_DN10109_c0_g1_i1.p1  ORF type:complete len:519 (-),score=143.29 TRINITY_DN10109_c0_g1_i1:151-1707(-)
MVFERLRLLSFSLVFIVLQLYVSSSEGSCGFSHGLLGAATDRTQKFWARTTVPGKVSVYYRKSGDPRMVEGAFGLTARADDLTIVLMLDGLQPATTYDYALHCDDAPGIVGTFKTFPAAGAPARFSYIFGSCLSPTHRPFETFDVIRAHQPNFMLLIGDLIYSDIPIPPAFTREHYQRSFQENWNDRSLLRTAQNIPSFMMWDDHELRNDYDQGPDVDVYPAAREAFDQYVGRHNPQPVVPGEIYYTFAVGDAEFFVLDTRSHRSPNVQTDDSQKTMLGALQKLKLKEWLMESPARIKTIVSSVIWSDHAGKAVQSDIVYLEAWFRFRTERDEILNFIFDNDIPNVFLLSADAHWSAVFTFSSKPPQKPRIIHEFSASPLSAFLLLPPPGGAYDILYLAAGLTGVWGEFHIDTTVKPATIAYTFFSKDAREPLYRLNLIEEADTRSRPNAAQPQALEPPAVPHREPDTHTPLGLETAADKTVLLVAVLFGVSVVGAYVAGRRNFVRRRVLKLDEPKGN